MTTRTDEGFSSWLQGATRGLPDDVRGLVRVELFDHYENAVDDHLAQGLSDSAAQQAALAELGDMADTSRQLQDIYLAERRYVRAAAASVAYPIGFLLLSSGVVQPWAVADILYSLVILLPALYVTQALKTLLRLRYNFHAIQRPVLLYWLGALLLTAPPVLSWLLLSEPVTNEALRRSLAGGLIPFQAALNIAYLVGVFVCGLGMMFLADRLMQIHDSIYGLRTPLFAALLLTGFALVGMGTAYIIESFNYSPMIDLIASVSLLIVIGLYIITNLLLTLLFFRAVYSKSHPMQAA